jgi:uncharacterized protein (DUF885 family)
MSTSLPAVALVVLLVACLAPMAEASDDVERLHRLFDARHAWEMNEFPEEAMGRGDYANAHRITDNSLAAIERRNRRTVADRAVLASIDRKRLGEQDLVSYELFELRLDTEIADHGFRMFLAPVGARWGPHQTIAQMSDRVRFATADDYWNYLKRLQAVPKSIENTIALMRLGLEEGRTPPRIVLRSIPEQLERLIDGEGLAELARPFAERPDGLDDGTWNAMVGTWEREALPGIREALGTYRTFVEEEYLPGCRESIAAVDLPDGRAYYAHQLRKMTTTDMTARQIHELGLKEVARIRAEMLEVIRRSDFLDRFPEHGSLNDDELFGAFVQYLRTDPRFYHETPEALLTGYRDICKRVDAWLPKFFRTLPRLPYGVKAIPDFMAPQQTTAYYSHGNIANGEAGYFYANTYALDERPTYEMIPLAIHEAVPGHHLQVALAQELEDLPEFRRDGWITAYGEGWALYAERLGIEMGMYEDPYDDFGRLTYEMWRACRLVVDPGMHALGWSRQQAIDFMLANSALTELNVETEVDRYIAWPGQACGYKIGELEIRRLRTLAEQRLGHAFDIRVFHEVVLGAGSVPLSTLERRVKAWLARHPSVQAYD